MSKMEYLTLRGYKNDREKQKLVKAYERGTMEHFANPNSIDVDKIQSPKKLRKYLSKYFRKVDSASKDTYDKIKYREAKRFRHFGTSYNLARCTFPTATLDEKNAFLAWTKLFKFKSHHVKHDHFEIIYFDNVNTPFYKSYLRQIFRHIEEQAYFIGHDGG